MIINKKTSAIAGLAGMALLSGIAFSATAFADTGKTEQLGQKERVGQIGKVEQTNRQGGALNNMKGKKSVKNPQAPSGIFGSVTAISGNSITISGKKTGPMMASSTAVVYNVDATNAKVRKGSATSTVADIIVGDNILVQGKITGTNIVAVSIFDGISSPVMGGRVQGIDQGRGEGINNRFGTSTNPIVGNGQPVIAGIVSDVSGTSLTIKNMSNVIYSVDASSAKFLKGTTTASVSDVVVGDKIVVQGVINGTSITASSVIDQGILQNSGSTDQNKPKARGIFGRIGGFLVRMFGF